VEDLPNKIYHKASDDFFGTILYLADTKEFPAILPSRLNSVIFVEENIKVDWQQSGSRLL
jgi:hypothetical protein